MKFLIQFAMAAGVLLGGCGGSAPELPAPSTAVVGEAVVPSRRAQDPQAAPMPTAVALMNWAQAKYPELFPGAAADRLDGPYVYRAYSTGNYIGIAGDSVYLLGPVTGGALQLIGALADFGCDVLPLQCDGYITGIGDTVAITTDSVITFNRADPSVIVTRRAITGLQHFVGTDFLVAIDYDGSGRLYALGRLGHIYLLDPLTGVASYQSTLAASQGFATEFTIERTTPIDIDFDPTTGNMSIWIAPLYHTGARAVIAQHFQVNMSTLQLTGFNATTSLNYTSVGFSSGIRGARVSTEFWVKGGLIGNSVSRSWSLGVQASERGGFDIEARSQNGYFISRAAGANTLYKVRADFNAHESAVAVGRIGTSEEIVGLALAQPAPVQVTGLAANNALVTFNPQDPGTLLGRASVTGLTAGEVLVGIDYRPSDRRLYGVTGAGSIYRISEAGVATFLARMDKPMVGTRFSVDFDPVRDRLRVIGTTGTHLEVDVSTGQTAVLPTLSRTTGATVVAGAAFTSSYQGSKSSSLLVMEGTTGREHSGAPTGQLLETITTSPGGASFTDIAPVDSAGPGSGYVLMAVPAVPGGLAGPSILYTVFGSASKYPNAGNALIGGANGPLLLDIAIKP